MKRKIVKIINKVLAPIGARVVRRSVMDMEEAIHQAAGYFCINTVIDIGASDGSWSKMAMTAFKKAKFLAIDPLEERVQSLNKLKNKMPNFSYAVCAAGDRDGETVELAVSDDLDGSTVGGTSNNLRIVPSCTIDSLVYSNKFFGPYLLKFDTHGFEVPILNGALNTLEQTDCIIMEVYNFRVTKDALLFHETCGLLAQKGFRCFSVVDPLHRPHDGVFWQMDMFFAKNEHPVFFNNSYKGIVSHSK